jgi:hypothetical protein
MRSMKCNVEFGYQLNICSGTKENHLEGQIPLIMSQHVPRRKHIFSCCILLLPSSLRSSCLVYLDVWLSLPITTLTRYNIINTPWEKASYEGDDNQLRKKLSISHGILRFIIVFARTLYLTNTYWLMFSILTRNRAYSLERLHPEAICLRLYSGDEWLTNEPTSEGINCCSVPLQPERQGLVYQRCEKRGQFSAQTIFFSHFELTVCNRLTLRSCQSLRYSRIPFQFMESECVCSQ